MKLKLFNALVYLFMLLSGNTFTQVRLINVNPITNEFSVKNFNEDTPPIDISFYRLVVAGTVFYSLSDTPLVIQKGSLILTGGDTVVFSGVTIPPASYIGLYLPGTGDDDFTDTAFMKDYVQWEISGAFYENTAIAAGLWSSGEFVSGNPPYFYVGNGLQNGASFWSETSLALLGVNIRLIAVNPKANTVQIKNFGTNTFDISDFRLSSKNKSTNNLTGQMLISGSLNMQPGDTTVIKLSGFGGTLSDMDTAAADLVLYKDADFSDTASLLDFVQWGNGGIGKESIAVSKGIWTAGDFVSGKYPYYYLGNGIQNGSEFWIGDTTNISIEDTNTFIPEHKNISLKIYPNPVVNDFFIIRLYMPFELEIFNIEGKSILREKSVDGRLVISAKGLRTGCYFLAIFDGQQYIYEKIFIENGLR